MKVFRARLDDAFESLLANCNIPEFLERCEDFDDQGIAEQIDELGTLAPVESIGREMHDMLVNLEERIEQQQKLIEVERGPSPRIRFFIGPGSPLPDENEQS
jgi:hypothetical protein